MKKPASVRAALAEALPALQRDPDKLRVFIDHGRLVATAASSLSFEYHYQLNLILTDYADDIDLMMVALLVWVKRNQNELMDHFDQRHQGIQFEADYLNHTTCDVSITLNLTERVIIHTDDEGRHHIEHADEPIADG